MKQKHIKICITILLVFTATVLCKASITEYNLLMEETQRLMQRKQYKEAVQVCKRAYDISLSYTNNYMFKFTTDTLAHLFIITDQYDQALPLLSKLLAYTESEDSTNTVALAQYLRDIARCHTSLGNNEISRPIYDKIFTIYNNLYGPDSKQVASLLIDQTEIYRRTEGYRDIIDKYTSAVNILEKYTSSGDPLVLLNIEQIQAGSKATIASIKMRLLQIKLTDKTQLADTSVSQLKSFQDELSIIIEQCYKLLLLTYTSDIPKHAPALIDLYEGRIDLKNNKEGALQISEQIVLLSKEYYGSTSIEHAYKLKSYAHCLLENKMYDDAKSIIDRARTIYESHYKPDASEMADLYESYAKLFVRTGSYTNAEKMYEQLMYIYKRDYGSTNIMYGIVQRNYAYAQEKKKEVEHAPPAGRGEAPRP